MLVDHEIAAVPGLIEPFVAHQVKAGNIGYGLSCAGYDCRLGLTVRWPIGGTLQAGEKPQPHTYLVRS